MPITIQSGSLQASIATKGAELTSLKDTQGTEYIWQAREDVWGRHAPVLFPIVGKLRNNLFTYNNREYSLPQHGFARDLPFRLLDSADDSAEFELRASEATKAHYPFDFIFRIRYELKERRLLVTYTVANPSGELLYFSVGAHPGFRIPLHEGESFTDYSLLFEPGIYNTTVLEEGLLSPYRQQLKLSNNRLRLTPELFDRDALVFEDHQINRLSLVKGDKEIIRLECENWPYFGVWTKKGCSEFVCLEPWYGVADPADSSGQLADKKGIHLLESGKEFQCSFSIILG